MPEFQLHNPVLFNASHARNLAETKWGRPHIGHKTKRVTTNRKGAFWFDCSYGSGFIIDGRCLTEQERADIDAYQKPQIAYEYYNTDGKLMQRTNPYVAKNAPIKHKPDPSWRCVAAPVYGFRESEKFCDREWCLPVLFAGIKTQNHDIETAFSQWQAEYNPSSHEVIELRARSIVKGIV